MITAGYSGTPLARKLGIKSGDKICLFNQPDYYFELFDYLPDNIELVTNPSVKKNFIHYFAQSARDLERDMGQLKSQIESNGIIWISWPKKASKVETDVTEVIIRNTALSNGLVDVKVCAIDNVWSALKLVIPVKERK